MSKLCVIKLCVSKLCVCERVVFFKEVVCGRMRELRQKAAADGDGPERTGAHNKKQEPHTKM